MKKRIISLLAAVSVAFISSYTLFAIQKEQAIAVNNLNRLFAFQKLASITDDIQSEFNRCIQFADFFDIIISRNPEITKEEIKEYAELIINQNKNIASVQLAKDAILWMIYPLEGNEKAIGHNLLIDPERKEYIERAIKYRISVTQGPIKARQGGNLVFNRKAIFINQDDEEKFWGLSIIAMDFDKLIGQYQEKLENENYLFAFRSTSDEGEFLAGDYWIFNEDAVIKPIALPDREWEIALFPKNNWGQDMLGLNNLNGLYSVVAAILFLLTYWSVGLFQEKIELSEKETLTQTMNKNAFEHFVKRKLSRKNQRHALIIIDLDNFKEINDTLGHPVGDIVLVEVSKRISSILRGSDRLSRIGGDEYMIFIDNIQDDEIIEQILSRMEKRVALPMVIDDFELKICLSYGYTIFPDHGTSFEELYKLADKRMYEHKNQNRTEHKKEQQD